MSKRLVFVLFLCILLQPLHSVAISAKMADIGKQPSKTVETYTFENGKVNVKKVLFPSGDIYWIKQFIFSADKNEPYTVSIPLPGKYGSFRYAPTMPENKIWATIPLDTNLPAASGFLQTNEISLLLNASNFYVKYSNGIFEQRPNPLDIHVIHNDDGYMINVPIPQQKNFVAEIWGLESKKPLVDWMSNSDLEAIWLQIDLQVSAKWSWDGYYTKMPQSYTPYSPNMYWRLPTNFAAHSFITTAGSRAAEDLGWVMLDTILSNQNIEGYWETLPRSEWLWKDYHIGAGFYDTRFNTDIAMLLLKGYKKYGDENFFNAAQKYSFFLLEHINKNHFKNYGESEGWLISDYSWRQPHKKTHVSLNHQLNEMNFLYQMFLETQQDFYKELADKLLYGVKNTKNKWIKPNNDLHYAYLANGTMGLSDYPFLTYNDLVESQTLLLNINGMGDLDLSALMSSKKHWMDQTGVYGYRNSPDILTMEK